MRRAIQLSQEELLLVLGILRLPLPPALGDDPVRGSSRDVLSGRLQGAMHGLVARGYVSTPLADDEPPRVDGGVADLVRAAALGESRLMVTSQGAGPRLACHYVIRDGRWVAHSSPQAWVHRLARVAGPREIVRELMAAISPGPHAPALPSVILGGALLRQTVEAAARGDLAGARAVLTNSSADAAAVDVFLSTLGSQPRSFALVAVSAAADGEPSRNRGAVVVRGERASWLATVSSRASGRLEVRPIAVAELQDTLSALVDLLLTPHIGEPARVSA